MTSTAIETIPTTWTTAEETFFGLVHSLFDTDFQYGAGVLLASYDVDEQSVETTPAVSALPQQATAQGCGRVGR